MTLQSFAVPDPPAGQDWSFVVPGINLVALQTVVGTLRTDLNPGNVVY